MSCPTQENSLYIRCRTCSRWDDLEYHVPEDVYCSGCGRRVGRVRSPDAVDQHSGVLNIQRSAIVGGDTGKEQSTVEWDHDRVELRRGD